MKKNISALLDKYRSAILIAIMLCFAIIGKAQVYTDFNYFGGTFKRIHATVSLGFPNDTFAILPAKRAYPHVAFKTDTMYVWNTTEQHWQIFRSGGVDSITSDTDSSYIWQGGTSFGIPKGGFFSPDQTSLGPTTHNLNGNIFNLISGGEYFIYLDPTPGAETSFFQAYNQTGNDNFAQLANSATNTSAQSLMAASFNASKQAFVILNASSGVSLANIIADSAKLEINRTVPISIADSALHWMMVMDRTTGMLRPAHWPAGGGSGIDSGAYRSMAFVDDSTVVFQRLDGTEDTLVYSAGSGGSGVSNFIDLADGPGAFTGQSLKSVRVNAGETALEYFTLPAAGDVTKVGTPVDNQIGVWTGNGTIEGPTTLTWSGSQLAVTGASTSTAGIDVFNGAYGSILLGGDLNAATRTNSTVKHGGIAAPHYLTAEEPVSLIRVANQSATNDIVIGQGVNPGYNSATSVGIYSAATNATLVGTRRFYLTNTLLHINDGSANYDFRVSGDNDANAFSVDADVDRVLVGTALGSGTDKFNVTGNIALLTAGSKLKIATGSNASIGVSGAMTAGTITISTTAVTASSIIMLTNAAPGGGTVGVLSVGTITAGTSFIINSSSGTDTSTVNWWIVN